MEARLSSDDAAREPAVYPGRGHPRSRLSPGDDGAEVAEFARAAQASTASTGSIGTPPGRSNAGLCTSTGSGSAVPGASGRSRASASVRAGTRRFRDVVRPRRCLWSALARVAEEFHRPDAPPSPPSARPTPPTSTSIGGCSGFSMTSSPRPSAWRSGGDATRDHHDLAVGVHPDGADSWGLADALARGIGVGAAGSVQPTRPELEPATVAAGPPRRTRLCTIPRHAAHRPA